MSAITQHHRAVPSIGDTLMFEAKAAILRLSRAVTEQVTRSAAHRFGRADTLIGAPIIAEARSPLWTNLAGAKDFALTAGKIQNLRAALRGLDGIEIPAGAVFSFWRQVGRATRRRGFVAGRELREGCLIASVGGGLCQLSNALFDAALQAGFEIVERHAHSRVVPGSRADLQRDATVFWNYVDLRFRSTAAFRVEARMTGDHLVIAFRARYTAAGSNGRVAGAPSQKAANDCTTCNQTACHRNNPEMPLAERPTAWLVDEPMPEFETLFARSAAPADSLFLPTRRLGRNSAAWAGGRHEREVQATLPAFRRAFALRWAKGARLQAVLMAHHRRLAACYAARLSPLDTHLVVAQSLLPHLWLLGALQGRRFDVLMERLPLGLFQGKLDAALAQHPESPTLGDYRAPAAIVAAEEAALAVAARLYTPHRAIAALDPARTVLLDWARPKHTALCHDAKSRAILFPASALGRKGAYVLREAASGLGLTILVAGRASEGSAVWGDLDVRSAEGTESVAAVVLPALVEHQPRTLLKALAVGIPTIATPACGLGNALGLVTVPENDAAALRAALIAVLDGSE